MTSNSPRINNINKSRALLFGCGLIFIVAALINNEFLLGQFYPDPPIRVKTPEIIRDAQAKFFSLGIGLLIVAIVIIRRISWLDAFTRKELVTNLILAILPVFTFLIILEFSLKPFAEIRGGLTTIFVRDSDLGWKLNPNSEDLWSGAKVMINGKGLRGPELNYTKQPNVDRILYLGDSVTFGSRLNNYNVTFPYRIENVLEDEYGYEVETINSGVPGYSPWQEYISLATEGIKYEPDLIVVSFVLNDVGEKLELIRFGGEDVGHQVRNTVPRGIQMFFENSSIVYFVRLLSARIRFGNNIQQGAVQQEVLSVTDLVYDPERPEVLAAWEITLQNLGMIFDYAKGRDIPVMLVVFPFTFQFEDVNALSAPQKVVCAYAYKNEVPVIDLLPKLFNKMGADHTRPNELFLDATHLSPFGSEIAAKIIADFIHLERMIPGN